MIRCRFPSIQIEEKGKEGKCPMEVDLFRDKNDVVKISICEALSLVLGFVTLLPDGTITKTLLTERNGNGKRQSHPTASM